MNEVILGGIVLIWIAVPLSLLVLLLADVVQLGRDGQRERWIRRTLATLMIPAALIFVRSAWGWAGAAHLEPLCQAYATPEFRTERPLYSTRIAVDRVSDAGPPPAWLTTLSPWMQGSDPSEATVTLEVRRVTHHANALFTVTLERFRMLDRSSGLTLAEGDELWIDAGAMRYHCGIESGRQPTRNTRYPSGDGVARFVRRTLEGPTVKSGNLDYGW